MRSKLLIPALAITLSGIVVSCSNSTSIDETFEGDATWVATVNGAAEVPAVATPATGRAWFIDHGTTIDYRMEYSGLLANANNAHIHRGAAGVANGPVMVQLLFVRQTGGVVLGTIDMTQADISAEAGTQTPDELRALLNTGGAYVNIHSSPSPPGFPAGEIRGQINRK